MILPLRSVSTSARERIEQPWSDANRLYPIRVDEQAFSRAELAQVVAGDLTKMLKRDGYARDSPTPQSPHA